MSKFENKIVNGNSLEVLKKIPDKTFNLIFADPPYNLQIGKKLKRPDDSKVNGVDDKWDQFKSFNHYDDFCKDWLKECKRILKDNGSIWIIGSYHNIFRLGYHLQNLNYWLLNDIIWRKNNPMPNFKGTRFTNAHETLIWASKNKKSNKEQYDKLTIMFANKIAAQIGAGAQTPDIDLVKRFQELTGVANENDSWYGEFNNETIEMLSNVMGMK